LLHHLHGHVHLGHRVHHDHDHLGHHGHHDHGHHVLLEREGEKRGKEGIKLERKVLSITKKMSGYFFKI
jgi:hypothetical protein